MLRLAPAVAILLAVGACVPERPADTPLTRGVRLPWTADGCRAPARDDDRDGIDDDCEFQLARAFAPELVVDPSDCAWDARGLGGGYGYAVESAPDAPDARVLRVAYLPAYYEDCGWGGAPCLTRPRGCAAHAGDSELVVVEVRHDAAAGRWLTSAIFLSAHCFGRSAGRCRWYADRELRRFTWAGPERGAPRVWVAKGKHGNYPSRRSCDAGHWFYDSCDGNARGYRFPILTSAQNVGSRKRPLPPAGPARAAGCIDAGRLVWRSASADDGTLECFWDPSAPFRGWQRSPWGAAPTPYARVLQFAAEF